MTENLKERWRNVAQAAQWLAEGREVEVRRINGGWVRLIPDEYGHVSFASWEQYRLKPEPPKPVEVWGWKFDNGQTARVVYRSKKKCENDFIACDGGPILLREVLPE